MADDVGGIFAPVQPKNPYQGVNDAVDLQNKLVGAQRNQQQFESEKIDLAAKQLGHMRNILSDILNNPEAGKKDLTKEITERAAYGAKSGLFTPAQVVEGLKTLPSDPRAQYQWLTTHLGSIMSATEKLNAYVGPTTTEGVGGGSVTTQTPAMPGLPVRTRKMQEYTLPPGTPEVITSGPNRGQSSPIGRTGVLPPQVPGAPQGFPSAPQAAPAPMAPGGPQQPATPRAAAPAQPSAAPTAPETGRRITTSLPPGTSEAMQAASTAWSHASDAAGKYGQRINPLRQAIPILERMKETDIGPTSERWNDIKSMAVTLGAGPIAGIDPEKIKDYNELKKYFNQYSAQVGATLGPKTNEGLATAVTSNPNVNMDRLSALELSKVALGIERMQQAGTLVFNDLVKQNQLAPGDYHKFMTEWGTRQDPRAFVYDLMDAKAQEKVKKLPPEERAKVTAGMRIAKQYGLLGDVHRE